MNNVNVKIFAHEMGEGARGCLRSEEVGAQAEGRAGVNGGGA